MPLKYVVYDKIVPHKTDDVMSLCYKWLGFYCGFNPQIWLARGNLSITGFKRSDNIKRSKYTSVSRKDIKSHRDSILFGFENIKGFFVDLNMWEFLMNGLFNCNINWNKEQFNKYLVGFLDEYVQWAKEDGYLHNDKLLMAWEEIHDLEIYLKKYLFIEKDQVVVPSLNLKSAKKILCRDERQKRQLRKMGFIEDRIQIKNISRYQF